MLTTRASRVYPEQALAKSSAGISSPFRLKAHKSPSPFAAFFVRDARACQFMAGRVGQPSGWPVSFGPGTANPARSASIMGLAAPGGGFKNRPKVTAMSKNNNADPDRKPLAAQLRTCQVMESFYQKSLTLHQLASLLRDCLDEDNEQPVQVPREYLSSLASAILCVNEQMDETVEGLIDTAAVLAK